MTVDKPFTKENLDGPYISFASFRLEQLCSGALFILCILIIPIDIVGK